MDERIARLLAAALPRLRGRLVPMAAQAGCNSLVIRHGVLAPGTVDGLITQAEADGLPSVRRLSLEQLAAAAVDLEASRFPACFIDAEMGLVVIAGDAQGVERWLRHFDRGTPSSERHWAADAVDARGVGAPSLYGKIVAVTGAASGIGLEIARAFSAAGSAVVAIDVNAPALASIGDQLTCVPMLCDVTCQADVDRCFENIAIEAGGLDILICNAGSAMQGAIGDVSMEDLRESFDLNFFAHQRVAQAGLRIFRRQRMGGLILFNISNQSVNLGRDFGPYGLAKAAELALMKQYAIDHGHEGIRSNGVNAGRIRTGLMTDEMIEARSISRGISATEYMAGNLLGLEVTARDVAQAFLHLALLDKVNAAVLTVDGGAMATSLR